MTKIDKNYIKKRNGRINILLDKANEQGMVKPIKVSKKFEESFWEDVCPKCDLVFAYERTHCPNCGQALDWSDQ